jgi:alkylation response protein AidB-like acyl-CoA dehydrogenase
MRDETGEHIAEIREAVAALCARYPEEYWRRLDETRGYPTEFVAEMTEAGFLNVLIPEAYGGSGLGLVEACAILEEISRRGAHAGACHAQMYVMGSCCATARRRRSAPGSPRSRRGGSGSRASG